MKYLLPLTTAIATVALISYAVVRAKRTQQWIQLTKNPGTYTLDNDHSIHMHPPHIAMALLRQKQNEEVGY